MKLMKIIEGTFYTHFEGVSFAAQVINGLYSRAFTSLLYCSDPLEMLLYMCLIF